MRAAAKIHRDLVLVGGGHSHALVLRMLAMQPLDGLRITLISPDSHTPYSGMLPGLIAGHYSFEQTHIDLAHLCQWAGVRFIVAQVTALDPHARRLSLVGRPPLDYDVVSIDVGSQPDLDSVPGAREHAVAVKPVALLWQRWQAMVGRLAAADTAEDYRISIVGGGAGSVELAMAMSHRLAGRDVQLDLWSGAPVILQNYNPRARRFVMAALARQGIHLHLNARVAQVEDACLKLHSGERAVYDDLFWCTGAAATPWIAASGLPTDDLGFLAVTDTLQSTGDGQVFGAGDIATQVRNPRPKAGVYAVRQAPVLAHNLRALLLHKPLLHHRPQQRFLSLISLGDKTAAADKGPFAARGNWVWRWKDRIDRAFMARFEDLPAMLPTAVRGSLPESDNTTVQAVCGGCGAKVSADALAGALVQLGRDYPDHCVGEGDDAALIPSPAGLPLVQSIDVLREIVSDPWHMGRIAANHALSDLYACGATPVSALATVTLPYATNNLLQRELVQLLDGALHEFAAVDCQLRGGHSMQGQELGLGFVVNGVASTPGGKLLSKRGAAVGDQLLLTKPLGTGALFAAHMQLQVDGRDVTAAVESMLQSNAAAATAALRQDASACTDITGFGLLGHLLEMLGGERGASLKLAQLPLLQGVLPQVRAGIVSTMHDANKRSAQPYLQASDTADETLLQMLFDPQTSGGLLLAIAPERTTTLRDELHRCGYTLASVIGEVTALTSASTVPVHVS